MNINKQYQKKKLSQDSIIYLNLCLVSNFVFQCLDQANGSRLFKHNLKRIAKRFEKELEKVSDEGLDAIVGDENGEIYKLIEEQELLLKRLAVSLPTLYSITNQFLDKLNDNPEKVIELLSLKLE